MSNISFARADITLQIDAEGIIEDAAVSEELGSEDVLSWRGRRWDETVTDVGGEKIKRMLEDAQKSGLSAFRQLTQCFPSGLEVPIEYTAISRSDGTTIAVGKNLMAMAELQSKLIAAQEAMERDYWKLREVETRYRFLFDASNEAVLLIDAENLTVIEANPAAVRAMGIESVGREIFPEIQDDEHEQLRGMLMRVRENGTTPRQILHFGANREPWVVHASLMAAQSKRMFLLQLAPVGSTPAANPSETPVVIDSLIQRAPDGFVVVDESGTVLKANQAFLDLVQIGAENAVVGQNLGQWIGRPGADFSVLLAAIRRNDRARLFNTNLIGELGTEAEVEISAVEDTSTNKVRFGLWIRDVSQRISAPEQGNQLGALYGSLTDRIGKTTLKELVRETADVVERHYIDAALELTNGNRTAAAQLLGLSRQSLYSKISRHEIDGTSSEGRRDND